MAPYSPMFDEDDPYLLRVRELAERLPGADVKVSHGRPVFFTKIAELLDASYRLTAPKTLIAELDARE